MSGHLPDKMSYLLFLKGLLWLRVGACAILVFLAFIPVLARAQVTDPCPALIQVMSNKTPDDLSLVQADIDRYTLCAKRAELLKKLNELAIENDLALKASTGLSNPGMVLGGGPPKPPAPGVALVPPDTATMTDSEVSEEDDGQWKIVEIFGSAGQLQAKLAKSDGSVARIKAGSSLPDGEKIISITPVRVTLHGDGGETELSWRE